MSRLFASAAIVIILTASSSRVWGSVLNQEPLDPIEANRLARAAYDFGINVGDSWTVREKSTWNPVGYQYTVFENKQTHAIVVAFAGTNGPADAMTDVALGLGALTGQHRMALQTADDWATKAHAESKPLILVGHSLGGALAAFGAMLTLSDAYVFNSAPLGRGMMRDFVPERAQQWGAEHVHSYSIAQDLVWNAGHLPWLQVPGDSHAYSDPEPQALLPGAAVVQYSGRLPGPARAIGTLIGFGAMEMHWHDLHTIEVAQAKASERAGRPTPVASRSVSHAGANNDWLSRLKRWLDHGTLPIETRDPPPPNRRRRTDDPPPSEHRASLPLDPRRPEAVGGVSLRLVITPANTVTVTSEGSIGVLDSRPLDALSWTPKPASAEHCDNTEKKGGQK